VAWDDADTSDWTPFIHSGESTQVSHAWSSPGTFVLRAQAMDWKDSLSDWSKGQAVSVFPALPFRITDSIPLPISPDFLTITPNGDYLYVTEDGGDVYVLHTSDGVLVDSFLMDDVGDPVVSPDSRFVYFACWDGYVYAVGTADNTVVDSVFAQEGATGSSLSPDGSTLYAVGWYDDFISVIRTSDMTLTESIPHGRDNISGVLVTGEGKSIYVLCSPVRVVSTESRRVVTDIPVGARTGELLADPEFVYLAHYGRGVYSIRTSDHQVVDTVFGGAYGLSAHSGGKYVYLATRYEYEDSAAVVVVNTKEATTTRILRVLGTSYPTDVACHPDGDRVFVGMKGDWDAWLYVLGY
jgi:DNA-binding beta-propeller fold protein YncE